MLLKAVEKEKPVTHGCIDSKSKESSRSSASSIRDSARSPKPPRKQQRDFSNISNLKNLSKSSSSTAKVVSRARNHTSALIQQRSTGSTEEVVPRTSTLSGLAAPTKPSPHIEKRIQKMRQSFFNHDQNAQREKQSYGSLRSQTPISTQLKANSVNEMFMPSSLMNGSVDGFPEETSTLSSNKADGPSEFSLYTSKDN